MDRPVLSVAQNRTVRCGPVPTKAMPPGEAKQNFDSAFGVTSRESLSQNPSLVTTRRTSSETPDGARPSVSGNKRKITFINSSSTFIPAYGIPESGDLRSGDVEYQIESKGSDPTEIQKFRFKTAAQRDKAYTSESCRLYNTTKQFYTQNDVPLKKRKYNGPATIKLPQSTKIKSNDLGEVMLNATQRIPTSQIRNQDHNKQRFMGGFNPYGNGQPQTHSPQRTLVLPFIKKHQESEIYEICKSYKNSALNIHQLQHGNMAFVDVMLPQDLPVLAAELFTRGFKPKPFVVKERKNERVMSNETLDDAMRGRATKKAEGKSNAKRDLVTTALITEELKRRGFLDAENEKKIEAVELARPLESNERIEGQTSITSASPPPTPSSTQSVPPPPQPKQPILKQNEKREQVIEPMNFGYRKPQPIANGLRLYYIFVLYWMLRAVCLDSWYIFDIISIFILCGLHNSRRFLNVRIKTIVKENERVTYEQSKLDMRTDIQMGTKMEHDDSMIHDVELLTYYDLKFCGFHVPLKVFGKWSGTKRVVLNPSQELLTQAYTVLNMIPLGSSDEEIYSRLHRTIHSTTTVNIGRHWFLSGQHVQFDTLTVAYHFAIRTKVQMTKSDFQLPLAYRKYATSSMDTATEKLKCHQSLLLRAPRKYVMLGTVILLSVVLCIFLLFSTGTLPPPSYLISLMPPQFWLALKNVLRISRRLVPLEFGVLLDAMLSAL